MRVTAEHVLVERIVEERESGLLRASVWGCYVEGRWFLHVPQYCRSQDRFQIKVYGYCAMSMTLRLR